jgi:hypothetical protein
MHGAHGDTNQLIALCKKTLGVSKVSSREWYSDDKFATIHKKLSISCTAQTVK